MTKNLLTGWGAILVLVGISAPGLMGMAVPPTVTAIHLASGAGALFVGLTKTTQAARKFAIANGVVYGLLCVVGFHRTGADGIAAPVSPSWSMGLPGLFLTLLAAGVFLFLGMWRTNRGASLRMIF